MTNENAEKITDKEQVAPAPVEPVTQTESNPVEAPVNTEAPVEAKTESKHISAYVKLRQEKRELKQKLAEAQAKTAPPPATEVEEQGKPEAKAQTAAPAPVKAEVDIEAESLKAIQSMSEDGDVAKVPGSIIDIIEMVDSDPRLSRLHSIDPTLAFREAKAIWASKLNIGKAPPVPKPTTISGGINSGKTDLESMLNQIEKLQPGTKEFSVLARKIDAEMNKGR